MTPITHNYTTANFPGMVQSLWRVKQVLWAHPLLPHNTTMVAVSRAEHAYQSIASWYTSWFYGINIVHVQIKKKL